MQLQYHAKSAVMTWPDGVTMSNLSDQQTQKADEQDRSSLKVKLVLFWYLESLLTPNLFQEPLTNFCHSESEKRKHITHCSEATSHKERAHHSIPQYLPISFWNAAYLFPSFGLESRNSRYIYPREE